MSRRVKSDFEVVQLSNSNLAAIIGLYRFLRKSQTPLWQRVQRRPSSWDQNQAR